MLFYNNMIQIFIFISYIYSLYLYFSIFLFSFLVIRHFLLIRSFSNVVYKLTKLCCLDFSFLNDQGSVCRKAVLCLPSWHLRSKL